MSTFQILMFAATLFFAFQIYRHVQSLNKVSSEVSTPSSRGVSNTEKVAQWVDNADKAYEQGEFEAARIGLAEALLFEPNNQEIINKLAFVTAKLGDRLKAIELYEHSLEIDEGDDLTHNAIASLYRQERAFERAQDHYRKAIEIDDEYAQTFYNYGNLLVDMDEVEEARIMYKRALDLQNDFPQAREALLSLGAKA